MDEWQKCYEVSRNYVESILRIRAKLEEGLIKEIARAIMVRLFGQPHRFNLEAREDGTVIVSETDGDSSDGPDHWGEGTGGPDGYRVDGPEG